MNLYEILGVKKNAKPETIKLAYRKLAKQYHPDRNPGKEECLPKYREVNEAYRVLSDPSLRDEYDRTGQIPGNRSSDEIPKYTEFLYSIVINTFKEMYEKNLKPESTDLLDMMKKKVKLHISDLQKKVKDLSKQKDLFDKALTRFRIKEGDAPNLIADMIRVNRDTAARQIEESERYIKESQNALTHLELYGYDFTPGSTSINLADQWKQVFPSWFALKTTIS